MTSDSESEVKIVTAVMCVLGAAATAALIIAAPPLACTVKNRGSKSEALFAACSTVLGIS